MPISRNTVIPVFRYFVISLFRYFGISEYRNLVIPKSQQNDPLKKTAINE